MKALPIAVERCNGGVPILSPGPHWWESGVTFNAAALFLERSPANDRILRTLLPGRDLHDEDLASGVVVIHYRARPETDPGVPFVRSFIGLALFTPDLKLLYRSPDPVLNPDERKDGADYLGVEDPRITRIGDEFYMVYCGLRYDPETIYHAQLCAARSRDLLHWEKLGPMKGDVNRNSNKDGVLFAEKISGNYVLLHRPWTKAMAHADYAIRLAVSDSPEGVWRDAGEILHSRRDPRFEETWVGAGAVPIPLGDGRYIMIYHTGNSLSGGRLEYDLDLALLDMRQIATPSAVVVSRIEPFMIPETEEELTSSSSLQVQNVVFTCGSYEYGEHIYIAYGGADTYLLVARVKKVDVLQALEEAARR